MHQLRQEFRQKLEQYLQPQQILRSELIQLPLLELELRVRAELQENPFLEEIPEDEAIVEKEPVEMETDASAASFEQADNDDHLTEEKADLATAVKEKEEAVDWESFLQDDEEHFVYKASRNQSEEFVETPRAFVPSLSEHLEEQMRLQRMTDEELRIGQYIIGSINKDGYLNYPVEEIARELNVDVPVAERVLRIVQQLDPPGIGARNLQ